MKKYLLPTFLALSLILLTYGGVEAQSTAASISGDEVCGTVDNKCTIAHLSTIVRGVLALIVSLGLPLLFVFIAYRIITAWFSLQQGNAGAYKDALKKAGNAIVGFLIVIALFGGLLLVMLQYLGVRGDAEFNPLQILRIFSEAFFTHAYAQTTGGYLPNPLGVSNLYDFLLSTLRLVMRFFIYPALIVMWVWTGFSFVAAQGRPEALSKAKKWFMWAVITTFIIFFLQTFLLALRGSVQQILPASQGTQVTASQTGTADGRTAPAAGTYGSACQTSTGATGQIGSDGSCVAGRGTAFQPGAACQTSTGSAGQIGVAGICYATRGSTSNNVAGYCTNVANGTLCTVTGAGGVSVAGTCGSNSAGVRDCYVAAQGTTCITSGGVYGVIDASGVCAIGGRPLVGRGGSCRISAECGGEGALTCVSGICQ